jgi:hypothetical protein
MEPISLRSARPSEVFLPDAAFATADAPNPFDGDGLRPGELRKTHWRSMRPLWLRMTVFVAHSIFIFA